MKGAALGATVVGDALGAIVLGVKVGATVVGLAEVGEGEGITVEGLNVGIVGLRVGGLVGAYVKPAAVGVIVAGQLITACPSPFHVPLEILKMVPEDHDPPPPPAQPSDAPPLPPV